MHDRPKVFWQVFWAMLAALVVFNVLMWALALLLAAGLVASWNSGSAQRTTRPGHLPWLATVARSGLRGDLALGAAGEPFPRWNDDLRCGSGALGF